MQIILHWLERNKEWVFSGAGVAVVTLFVSWLMSQKSQAKGSPLRITTAFGFLTFGPEISDQMFLITVANAHEKPIQVAGVKVPLRGNRTLFFPHLGGEKSIPCFIDGGTSLKFWTDLKELQATLRSHGYAGTSKIRAVVTDGTGVEYKGNTVKLVL